MNSSSQAFFSHDKSKLLSLFLLCMYLLPLVILRENAYIYIFDNLDSVLVYDLVLKKSGTIFSSGSTIVPNIMNGIPRSFFQSGINIYMVLIYFFNNILYAYILNAVIVHFIAYIGMYRLLSTINSIQDNEETGQVKFIKAFAALCFAVLPFQTNYGLCIAGIPLLFSAYLGLLTNPRQRVLNYLCIAIYPLYCINIFSTPFVTAAIILFGVYVFIKHKDYYLNYFIYGILLLVALFIVTDYQILYGVLVKSKDISHRYDFHLENYYPSIFSSFIPTFLWYFIFQTKMTEYCLQLGVIIAIVVLLILQKRIKNPITKALLWLNLIVCIYWVINETSEFQAFKNNLGFLRTYHTTRFSFLLPTSWYVVFFLVLKEIYDKTKKIGLCRALIALQLIIILVSHPQGMMVLKRIIGYNKNTEKEVTYKQLYSTELFSDINHYIGKPQSSYRVVCVGFLPSIALFNGFYTLDNYQNNYLLSYKKKFRLVIEKELAKSEEYRKQFDYWGHTCEIKTSEIPFFKQAVLNKTCNYKINNLEINTTALKDLGCQYVFSAVEIKNFEKLHMKFLKSFERNDSMWKIYVYQLL